MGGTFQVQPPFVNTTYPLDESKHMGEQAVAVIKNGMDRESTKATHMLKEALAEFSDVMGDKSATRTKRRLELNENMEKLREVLKNIDQTDMATKELKDLTDKAGDMEDTLEAMKGRRQPKAEHEDTDEDDDEPNYDEL